MSKTDMYIYTYNNYLEVVSTPTRTGWDYKTQTRTINMGLQFSNVPFKYAMEFVSLSTRYHAVKVKLLTAPRLELVNGIFHLDGTVFEDLLKHGNVQLGRGAVLEENLVFKYKGTMKLCRQ